MVANRKLVTERQDNRPQRSTALVELDDGGERRPDPPADLRPDIEAAWEAFWRSRLARFVDRDSQIAGLMRWAWVSDELARVTEAIRRKRTVRGSMGQPVLSPLVGYRRDLVVELEKLEANYGMNPKAALNLGLTFATMTLTAERINELARLAPAAETEEAVEGEFRDFEPA